MVSDYNVICQATVFKPAVMIGTEDRILNRWAQFVKKFGFLALVGNGSRRYILSLTI